MEGTEVSKENVFNLVCKYDLLHKASKLHVCFIQNYFKWDLKTHQCKLCWFSISIAHLYTFHTSIQKVRTVGSLKVMIIIFFYRYVSVLLIWDHSYAKEGCTPSKSKMWEQYMLYNNTAWSGGYWEWLDKLVRYKLPFFYKHK